jgi:hypothetical protein
MNADDQLRDLQERVKALEDEVFRKPGPGPTDQPGISSEVEERLRQLSDELAALTTWQKKTDHDFNRALRIVDELQRLQSNIEQLQAETAGLRVLSRWVREAKDVGLRVLTRWVREVQARARTEGQTRARTEGQTRTFDDEMMR